MMGMPTFLDVVRLNGADPAVGLIEEASQAHPEVQLGAARTIKGLNYPTNVRTAVPVINFRKANEGTAIAGSTFEQRLVECYIMNPPFECDKVVAESYDDGWEAYLALEALGITEGAFQALGTAFIYGTDTTLGKTDAFPGLLQSYDGTATTGMVVDAGGSTATTGSSVWGVRWGPLDVQWVLGQDGKVEVSDVTEVRLTDAAGNPYTGLHQDLYLRPGLQVASIYSIGRIKKVTEDADHTLTDDMIYDLLAKFPAGKPPNVLYMSRRSLYQLRNSRTATNPSGTPAPIPTSVENIPIQETDSIVNTEELTL